MEDKSEIKTPIKAIRAKCLDCSGGSSREVERCVNKDCALYPYRKGHNPRIQKRELTEEEKNVLRERMKAMREKAKAAKK